MLLKMNSWLLKLSPIDHQWFRPTTSFGHAGTVAVQQSPLGKGPDGAGGGAGFAHKVDKDSRVKLLPGKMLHIGMGSATGESG